MLLQKIFYHFHPIVSDLFGQSNQGDTVGLFLMFMNNTLEQYASEFERYGSI